MSRLPEAIIIGAQRSGTTRFYNRMVRHSQVAPSSRKEIHFYDVRYDRGIEYYKTMFAPKLGRISMEASPYYIYHPAVAERIYRHQPDVKIIAMLRNPIDRAFSNYFHEVRRQQEPFSFEEAIEKEPNRIEGEEERILQDPTYYSVRHNQYSYLARSDYAPQLQRYYDLFPSENIYIIKSEDFFEDEMGVLRDVQRYLGLIDFDYPYNPPPDKKYKDMIREETRQQLVEYFKPRVKELKKLTGVSWKEYE
jgi:hypothetical protein